MTALPQAQVSVWKMGHHPQRERPSELAAFIEAAGRQAAASSEPGTARKPRRSRVLAVRSTPRPLAAGTGDFSAVA